MFGNFTKAKRRKAPRWAVAVLGGAVVAHVVLFMAMWIKTIWDIEHLDKPKQSIDLAIAPTPPPPPPPPPGGAKPHDVVITPKHPTVKDIVQPVKIDKPITELRVATTEVGSDGPPDGIPGGTDPNSQCFDCEVGPAVPVALRPPPPPSAPTNVAPQMLEASRIAGNKIIEPTDTTKTDIQRSGKTRIVGSYKLCLSADGEINSVSTLKSTGFPAYDNTITSRIRGEWRYRPFMVNNKAVAVCTAVTFIYSQ